MSNITTSSSLFARTTALLILLLSPATVFGEVVVNDFDDIINWTGTGSNRAAVVIDWDNGSDPLVWGYRFDTATSADMVQAVVEADSRLFAKVEAFSFGWFVHGFGYDRNATGFSISTGTDFGPSGFVFSGDYDDATSIDPFDSYRETDALFANSWSFWNGTGNDYPGANWLASGVGISDRALSDLAWDGFRFNTAGFGNETPPGLAFAAVPEPNCCLEFSVLLPALCNVRRRKD